MTYHGTLSGYSYHECRCKPCRSEWNRYQREHTKLIRMFSDAFQVIDEKTCAECSKIILKTKKKIINSLDEKP